MLPKLSDKTFVILFSQVGGPLYCCPVRLRKLSMATRKGCYGYEQNIGSTWCVQSRSAYLAQFLALVSFLFFLFFCFLFFVVVVFFS